MNDYQDKQSRKWLLTINNPKDLNLTHEGIKTTLSGMKSVVYWCMADEIGEQGTYHTHLYIACSSGLRASTLHKKFTGAHRDIARGTSQENKDYVTKSGKWSVTKKAETSVDGTFEEWGEMPIERQGSRTDIADLYSMIKDGLTDYEILEQSPDYLLQIDKIDKVRQTVRQETYKNQWRSLTVTYIWGDTGSGKTRGVMEKYGYENVYRVTDYLHPWDSYHGQDVVVFEEFRSSQRIGDMLNYLDGYPLELPCRYNNKYACYTQVYIISNIPISQQYTQLQIDSLESYHAFLRRINSVHHYTGGKIEISHINLVGNGFRPVLDDEIDMIPFREVKNENSEMDSVIVEP